MYPKLLYALTGIVIVFFTACTASRATCTHSLANASSPVINKHVAASGKSHSVTGPPEYFPDTISTKAVAPKIIERGGHYVFIPPAYMMARPENGTEHVAMAVLQQRIGRLKKYAQENGYDTSVAFFIDMQVKSCKERFFVVDLATMEIIKKALVAHGKGNEKFTFNRKFSNEEGSNCSSLGIYKIGKGYNGAFGLSYKLYGLSKTNSNALRRYVVLHAMGSIPEAESKWAITQTEGCPAVAPSFLAQLAPLLDKPEKNILLYIYFGKDN